MKRGPEGNLPADFISTRRAQISQDIKKVWGLRADLEQHQGQPFVTRPKKIGPGILIDEEYIKEREMEIMGGILDLREKGFVEEADDLTEMTKPPKPENDPLDAFLRNNQTENKE